MIPSVIVLGLAAVAAGFLASNRPSPPDRSIERRGASRVLALATAAQAVHFAEEALTGLPEQLGAAVGLPPMPTTFFIVFNLLWLGLWIAAIPGVRSGHRLAFFAAWFLAIAGMFNGIAHPLLSAAAGGYFSGVWSSTLIAAASVWLWTRLRRATAPTGS